MKSCEVCPDEEFEAQIMLQGLVNGTSGLYPGLFESQQISMPYALVFPESACEGQEHGARREAGSVSTEEREEEHWGQSAGIF